MWTVLGAPQPEGGIPLASYEVHWKDLDPWGQAQINVKNKVGDVDTFTLGENVDYLALTKIAENPALNLLRDYNLTVQRLELFKFFNLTEHVLSETDP